jgi:hypothetical protein
MYGDDRAKDYWFRSQVEFPERSRFYQYTIIKVVPDHIHDDIIMKWDIYSYDDTLIYQIYRCQDDVMDIVSASLGAEKDHNMNVSP